MTSDEDGDDLTRLRERVYGPDSGQVSPSDVERLAALEDRQRMVTLGESTPRPEPPRSEPEEQSPDEPAMPEPAPDAPTHRRWPTLVGAGLAVILAGAIGFVVGASQPDPPSLHQSPLQSELSLPQTEEDVLQSPADAGVDSSTTRFVARLDGYNIYVGFKHQPDTQYFEDVPCLIITAALTSELNNVACGDVATRVGVERYLEVGIGDTGRNELGADRILLSENVVAYRYERAIDE